MLAKPQESAFLVGRGTLPLVLDRGNNSPFGLIFLFCEPLVGWQTNKNAFALFHALPTSMQNQCPGRKHEAILFKRKSAR